ncbi:MAG TPA: Type 1 glutamine amidotransferase-like domain-containing protein [Anaerolineales bacterium]|nr:Type 1 glutamine amidotransferase-like domain-containing protein [Anaerolineales bacterium]
MNGLIALAGSGEYLPVMEDVDRHLLDSLNLNGRKPRVVCLPTAAGKEGDQSVNRWSNMGIRHFERLGAEVNALRIIDRASAQEEQHEPILENADLIYFSGGDPGYLYETLKDTCAWRAAQRAWARGAVYAGCSAGAMILARRIPSFRLGGAQEGFGLLPAEFVVPHFDAIPAVWKPVLFALQKQLKDGQHLVGVDEETALVGSLNGEWKVMGQGSVHIFTRDQKRNYKNGDTILLP